MAKRCKFVDFEAKEVVDVSDSDDDISVVSASEDEYESSDSNDLDSNDDPHWYRKNVDRAEQCRLGTLAIMAGSQFTLPRITGAKRRSGRPISSSPPSQARPIPERASSQRLRSSGTMNPPSFTQLLEALTGLAESQLQAVTDTIDVIRSTRQSASQVRQLVQPQSPMIPNRIAGSRTFNQQVEEIITDAIALPKSSPEKQPSPSDT